MSNQESKMEINRQREYPNFKVKIKKTHIKSRVESKTEINRQQEYSYFSMIFIPYLDKIESKIRLGREQTQAQDGAFHHSLTTVACVQSLPAASVPPPTTNSVAHRLSSPHSPHFHCHLHRFCSIPLLPSNLSP